MIVMAIDGACRRNGKPDCLSVGSVFIRRGDNFFMRTRQEQPSTNQRGELLALIIGLDTAHTLHKIQSDDIYLITDSEYVFNAVSKDWVGNWRNKGWRSSTGDPVKNRDLWEIIGEKLDNLKNADAELLPFHIKGHIFPFGKVAAAKIIGTDPSGEFLYRTVKTKVLNEWDMRVQALDNAVKLFGKNNGYYPPVESFAEMVICNTTCDLIAGYTADLIESSRTR